MPTDLQDSAQPEIDGGDSIANDLAAAFATAEKSATPDAPAAPAKEPVAPATTDTSKPAAPAQGQPRDPAGKYAAKDAQPAAPATVEPLHDWPEDQKQFIRDLAAVNPDMAKKAFDRLKASEDEFSRRSQEFKPFKDLREKIDPLLAPTRQQRLMRGQSDEVYLQSLLAHADLLERSPVEGLQRLASAYGVNFAQLAQQAQEQANKHPDVIRLEQQIQQLQQGLTGVHSQTEQQQLAAAQAQLESFAGEKDASGQPLRPHFASVMNEIGLNIQFQRQMNPGATIDLQAAYDKAIRMNDSVWQQVQAAQASAREAAAEEQRKREITEAKRAGFSVTGSGADVSSKPAETWEQELTRQFALRSAA